MAANLGNLTLVEQLFEIEGRVFTMIAPLDVDAVLDLYTERGQLERDFYWARVWPSAVALARLLLQRPSLVAGKRVADFGCGLGLAGLAASMAGAREVVLLDREPLALKCALASAHASGIANVMPLSVSSSSSSNNHDPGLTDVMSGPEAERLVSHAFAQTLHGNRDNRLGSFDESTASGLSRSMDGREGAERTGMPEHGTLVSTSYSARVFDWFAPPGDCHDFDVVLACDVLYEKTDVESVAGTIQTLLAGRTTTHSRGSGRSSAAAGGTAGQSSGGLVGEWGRQLEGRRLLLADPPRRTALNRERFVSLLAGQAPRRLAVEEVSVQPTTVTQLAPMLSGHVRNGAVLSSSTTDVQLVAFRSVLGNDTVGVKA